MVFAGIVPYCLQGYDHSFGQFRTLLLAIGAVIALRNVARSDCVCLPDMHKRIGGYNSVGYKRSDLTDAV